ncbi:MAG: hypothetical protein R3C28_32660 [Pirellulaceae bacterium]
MRCVLALAFAALTAVSASAAVVGEASPLADGSVDGWSGITVMDGYGGLPAGESVSTVNYYASDGRADGNRSVQPLIIKNDGGVFSIYDVGPVDTPTAGGEVSMSWGSSVVPNDGAVYHPGFWQWNAGVDDTDGGVVSFAGTGGSGMFQENEDGTTYVPAIGDEVVSGHASGADGRAYQMNFTTAVPEPSTGILAALAIIPLLALRRRK